MCVYMHISVYNMQIYVYICVYIIWVYTYLQNVNGSFENGIFPYPLFPLFIATIK